MEREVSHARATQRKLGDAVGWIVDTLLLDEGELKDDAAKKTLHKRKQEALESLAYVRDILKGTVVEVEDDRLVGEEEVKRRKEKEKRQVYWQFIVGMLTNSSPTMPLGQISMMMKMLIADGFPWSNEELQEFLGEKIADGELEIVGGKYKLVKK